MEEAPGDLGANPAGDTTGDDELCDWTIKEKAAVEAAVAGCKRKTRQRTRGKGSAGNH